MALYVQVEALIGVYDLHEISEMEQDNKERAGRKEQKRAIITACFEIIYKLFYTLIHHDECLICNL